MPWDTKTLMFAVREPFPGHVLHFTAGLEASIGIAPFSGRLVV